jgi:hypothetical protein
LPFLPWKFVFGEYRYRTWITKAIGYKSGNYAGGDEESARALGKNYSPKEEIPLRITRL